MAIRVTVRAVSSRGGLFIALAAVAASVAACGAERPVDVARLGALEPAAEAARSAEVTADAGSATSSSAAATTTTTTLPPWGAFDDRASTDEYGYVRVPVGCLPDLEPETLDEAFGNRIGPLIGWDNPHIYPLGPDRWLWIVQDAYLAYNGRDGHLHDDAGYQIQNLAILQEGTCWTLVHRGTPEHRINFEPGTNTEQTAKHFFWPLGGARSGDRLLVFWQEMVLSDPPPPPGDGIIRHPVATWIAEYDPDTLVRRTFEPAPDDGVFPSYGFAVAEDADHSYLFGNSNLLNFAREGGFLAGNHSATEMYLARVRRGALDDAPEYWSGERWSGDAADATTISKRFFAENTMQPLRWGDRWFSVTKENGMAGSELVVDVADRPEGPWRTVYQAPIAARSADESKLTYQPIILPWSDPDVGLDIVISENAEVWKEAVRSPALYRPSVHRIVLEADAG